MDGQEDGERQQMLGVFLVEAWDTLAAIEEVLEEATAPGQPPSHWVDRVLVVAHRLRGSAGLYGFPEVSDLGRAMEQLLEEAAQASPEDQEQARRALAVLARALREALEAVGTPAPVAQEPGALPELPEATGDGLRDEVRRFFADSGDVLAYFGPEAAEHLETMTNCLLLLEQEGPSKDELTRLFRAVHTLKGAAYTVGFTAAGRLAHCMEDVLAAVRDDRAPLTASVIEAALTGIDALKAFLAGPEGFREGVPAVVTRAFESLRAVAPPPAAEEPGAAEATAPLAETLPAPAPAPEEARGEPATRGRAGGEGGSGARPSIRVGLDRLDSLMSLVGELVIARSRLERRLVQLERVGQLLLFSRGRIVHLAKDLEARQVEGGPAGAGTGEGGETPLAVPGGGPLGDESLSQLLAGLDFERYDDTAMLARATAEIAADVSEVQAQLAEVIRSVSEETSQIQRLTGGLRNEVTHARMVPLGTLFARFARQVRETARATGKRVVLQVSGESVEVDNSIIEQLADPLLHLVRNAVAHGIEADEERRARGKRPEGTVCLHAYHQGGAIYVEVEDDGRGMDPAALTEQAVRRGFLAREAAAGLSEREALELIFLPGFSTSAEVTAAAGRGVGMDVVRTNVRRLNGEIGVETEPGVGTRFTIKLPLTVIIAEALFVRVGTERLAIPLTAVRMIRTIGPDEVHVTGHAEMIRVEGELVDLLRMDRLLELPSSVARVRTPVVVMRSAGRSIAVAVDELVGKEEIVIKSLGGFLEGLGPFAGATISGEGRVILLLDPARLSAILAPAPGATIGPEAAGEPVPAAGRRAEGARRVLLVDDSISVRRFVGQMLQRAGFDVTAATDGADALDRLGDGVFHAVITDLEMPRMNGYELVEDLRRRPSTRDIPVVVLTTRAGGKHLGLARRLGVEHYITKPAEEQALVGLLRSLTSRAAPAPPGVPR